MRGQTTIDFAIGVSVFVLAVAFVFAIVPAMLEPMVGTAQEETVAVERVASQIAEGTLGDPSTPYVLDVGCATYFFGGPSETGCRFSGDSLQERVGLDDAARVHVRVVGGDEDGDGEPDVLCNDGTGTVDERGDVVADGGSCDTAFEAGDAPPAETGSVTVARRLVSVDGVAGTMKVRMW